MSDEKQRNYNFSFNADGIAPQGILEAFPKGKRLVAITDADVTANDGGSGERVSFQFEILEGPYKGRKVWDGFNVTHSNEQTQRIARGQMSGILNAIKDQRGGSVEFATLDELFNFPFIAMFDLEPGKGVNADGENCAVDDPAAVKVYNAKNNFKGAEAGTEAPAEVAPGAPGAQQWAKTPKAPAAGPKTPAAPKAPVKPAATPAKPAAPAPKPPAPKPPAPKPPAKPADKRKFLVYVSDTEMPVADAADLLASMKEGSYEATTQLFLADDNGEPVEGEGWKTADEYGLKYEPEAAAEPAKPAAPKPPAKPAAPAKSEAAAPAAAGKGTVPWKRPKA